jgi:hypothetical protein
VDGTVVVSTAITGAVGIAGVAGTIIAARIAGNSARQSARLSIAAETDRARLADKRQVYAHTIAAMRSATAAAVKVSAYGDHESAEGRATAARENISAALAALEAVSALMLVAPPPIVNLADQVMNCFTAFHQGTLDRNAFAEARHRLYDALRADLDEEASRLSGQG